EILNYASDASKLQSELCERFAESLHCFFKADWDKASKGFKAILKDFPHDGPTKFYATQCQQRLTAEVLPDNPWVINMSQK
ncbi:MAG: hypothetical protein OEY09_15635, partial [Gammaproteobacteria bacterium]|nr:hypothetical protein [Gammaproteobacteria bacterium]